MLVRLSGVLVRRDRVLMGGLMIAIDVVLGGRMVLSFGCIAG
ncbi:hypothetical protein HDF13_001442 [Edaphobacter lichenicola]|uniref:Uncharacterized protein n=1 Tax=Tunturiibacter gelidiferens TaxID=3069689 RepID=A0ACC5NWZ2_9BACT|nr:hypothetical protein [Edaphobacter lichenicola]